MRRYRSQRIQKTLIALSGAALASTMMFTSAQSIGGQDYKKSSPTYSYYKTKIDSQIHKAVKANKEEKHKNRKSKVLKTEE